eukprot:TRINITY_DN14159_c0_g1_i4.p1 TRINITY_DN14159_c0_g1~~TRINITY_DN14159_c0_g1_i4.p1  ORF type:complete len:156 (-),score=17.53 TRINITY_DN14159_c0_g1_i4:470-907(-)
MSKVEVKEIVEECLRFEERRCFDEFMEKINSRFLHKPAKVQNQWKQYSLPPTQIRDEDIDDPTSLFPRDITSSGRGTLPPLRGTFSSPPINESRMFNAHKVPAYVPVKRMATMIANDFWKREPSPRITTLLNFQEPQEKSIQGVI